MPKFKQPIELGGDNSKVSGACAPEASEGISLYLPDISDLGKLPEAGEITFRYCRKSVTLNDDTLSAQLILESITALKADPDVVEEKADTMDALFAEATKAEADRGDDNEVELGTGQPL